MLPGVFASHSQKRSRDIGIGLYQIDSAQPLVQDTRDILPRHALIKGGLNAQAVRIPRRIARTDGRLPVECAGPAGAGAALRRAARRLRYQRSIPGGSRLAEEDVA